nr:two-component sensor histidine kinase [uncultured bacterium]
MYVLMIEDDEAYYHLIRRYIAHIGDIQIEWRNTIEQGLAYLDAHPIDLLLLDMMLPDGDGLTALGQVQIPFPTLPIIILTGEDSDELAFEAVRRGAQDYLVKARIDATALRRSLRYAIERKRLQEQVRRSDELYRTFARNFPNGALMLYDHDLRYNLIDGQGMADLGLSKEEMEGKTLREVFSSEVADEAEARMRAVLSGETFNREILVRGQTLAIRHVPIRDGSGAIISGMMMSQNITERKRAEERFRALLESAPDAMVIVDEDGMVVLVNSQTEQIFGYDREELIGRSSQILAPIPFRENDQYQINDLEMQNTGDLGKILSFYALRKDGSQFPVEVSLSPIEIEEGLLVAMSIRDVTERKLAEQQVLELAHERERVQLLSNFVRDISHDFRNPLATLTTSLYILARATETEKKKVTLERAEQQIARLTQLIDRLLIMTRLDTETALELYTMDVNRLITDFCSTLSFDAKKKAIQVACSLWENSLPIQVNAKEFRLALAELGKNALEYTPVESTITIRTRQQDNQAVVEVADSGIGIPSIEFALIFQRLYRVDKARSSETGGSGLGLSIVKRIIELHHGRVAVESVVGAGSTFRIFLPLIKIDG